MTYSDFIALVIYLIIGTNISWNEGIDTCFNVQFVLLGRNLDFLGGYCSLPSGYCSLLGGYCSLLVVTARYRSLLLVPTFSMNALVLVFFCKFYEIFKNTYFYRTPLVAASKTRVTCEICLKSMISSDICSQKEVAI